MQYTVIWKKEIEATSPEQAVRKALEKLKPCYVSGGRVVHKGEAFQVEWCSSHTRIVRSSTTD